MAKPACRCDHPLQRPSIRVFYDPGSGRASGTGWVRLRLDGGPPHRSDALRGNRLARGRDPARRSVVSRTIADGWYRYPRHRVATPALGHENAGHARHRVRWQAHSGHRSRVSRRGVQTVGSPVPREAELSEECITVWKAVWSDGNANFTGRFFTLQDVVADPKPIQRPGPPVWLGGGAPAVLRHAARIADGWHPISLSLADYRAVSTTSSRACREAERDRPLTLSYSGGFGLVGVLIPRAAESATERLGSTSGRRRSATAGTWCFEYRLQVRTPDRQ